MTSLAEAKSILESDFGVDVASVRRLDGEFDENFLVTSAAGERSLFKHCRESSDVSYLNMQDAVLAHLDLTDIGSPRHLGTSIANGRTTRLLSWVEGEVWAQECGDGPASDEQLRSLGQTVAITDRALNDFFHPALARRDPWNLLQVSQLLPVSNKWAQLVLDGSAALVKTLIGLPQQAIHNDASENNIVLGLDGSLTLIDYGDLASGPRVVGLGVAMAYSMFGQRDPLRAAYEVVAGYHYEVPLTPEELTLLDGVVRLRPRSS